MIRIGCLSRRGLALLLAAGFLTLIFPQLTAAQALRPGVVLGEDGRLHGLGLRDTDISGLDPARRAPHIPIRVPLRAVVDNTAGLPPVGDQGSQGSCGAWSVGYYCKTYLEGKEHGWNVSTPDHQFSPAYIYNQARIPADGGMWFNDTMLLVEELGCPTLATMPYNQGDYTSWPPEAAYREALRYRTANHYWIETAGAGALDQVKAHVDGGNIGLLAITIWGNFDNISSYGYNYCVADRTGSNRGGHAVTIVGYDDGRVTHDGTGAFRCVNQWGTGWGDSGFFWISYQAVTDAAHKICQGWYGYMEDLSPDEPTYAARFQLSYPLFRALGLQVTAGGAALDLFNFRSYQDSRDLPVGAPAYPIWVDLTPVMPLNPGDIVTFVAQNMDPSNGTSGQIASFDLYRFSDGATAPGGTLPAAIPSSGTPASVTAPFTFAAACSLTCTTTVPATGMTGSAVAFQSTATPTNCAGSPSFAWTFGDGGTGSEQNTNHIYSTAGTFNWTLAVTVDAQTCFQSGFIVVAGASQCSITCDTFIYPDSGPAPLAVSFDVYPILSDCTGSAASHWTFGDGGSADGDSVTHTYLSAGIFIWTVTVTADGESCTQTGTVTATAQPGKPGDCDGNGTVSIGEVQKAINMFLGIQAVGCGVDCNGDGTVSIGEVQKVINGFLGLAASC